MSVASGTRKNIAMAQFLPLPPQLVHRSAQPGLAVAALALGCVAAHAAGLNDTGQTTCHTSAGAVALCAGDQDARFGRDAVDALLKTGAGAAGFDYTKIGNNGGDQPAGSLLGPLPNDWACTRDNVTDLMWEMKTSLGGTELRNANQTYTWYSIAANNGGNAGSTGSNTCNGSLAAPPYSNQCNTTNYVLAVNAATLCGHNDWRLPSLKELQSLANSGAFLPAIDTDYFPATQTSYYWSGSNYAAAAVYAWTVHFSTGASSTLFKTDTGYIRLVRGGP
jgi:hypothetical protein